MAKFGEVAGPYWDDRPVAIIGGGPSLKGFDLERLRGAHVLAVKGSIFDVPWADAGFGLDWPRFQEWHRRLAAIPMRIYWAVDKKRLPECPDHPNMTFIERWEGEGVSDDPSAIYNGGTSGYGALQIAVMKRARKIALFGYDYSGDYSYNSPHFHHNSEHYQKRRLQNRANWLMWARNFTSIEWIFRERNIEVVNACPASAISAFRRVHIDEGVRFVHT